MPGPVSDSYDPVWGTAANEDIVRAGLRECDARVSAILDSPPRFILDVALEENGPPINCQFSERLLRLMRFGLRVALEEESL